MEGGSRAWARGLQETHSQPPDDIELTLVDANPHVLDHCSDRLATWEPTTIVANVLEPLPVEGPFDSAGLAHIIHCLPGPMAAKARAIEHIAAVLTQDGVLFGGTVLGLSAKHTWAARSFLRLANLQGGFDNREDDVNGLQTMLKACFREVEIDIPTGSLAYFRCFAPSTASVSRRNGQSVLDAAPKQTALEPAITAVPRRAPKCRYRTVSDMSGSDRDLLIWVGPGSTRTRPAADQGSVVQSGQRFGAVRFGIRILHDR